MSKYLAIFVAVLPLVFADVVPVKECKAGALPISVDVVGCKQPPCDLKRGEDAVAFVEFVTSEEIYKLRPVVYATALGLTVPFEMPDDRQDACEWLEGTKCPLSAGEDVRYELRLPVEKNYPSIAVDVELRLVDQNDEIVSCFSVLGKVV